MNLVYRVQDKPRFGETLVFALQQLLAILAATIAVPSIVGNGMSQSAALFGAGASVRSSICFLRNSRALFSWDPVSLFSVPCSRPSAERHPYRSDMRA